MEHEPVRRQKGAERDESLERARGATQITNARVGRRNRARTDRSKMQSGLAWEEGRKLWESLNHKPKRDRLINSTTRLAWAGRTFI